MRKAKILTVRVVVHVFYAVVFCLEPLNEGSGAGVVGGGQDDELGGAAVLGEGQPAPHRAQRVQELFQHPPHTTQLLIVLRKDNFIQQRRQSVD
jgi:hypothetical protein